MRFQLVFLLLFSSIWSDARFPLPSYIRDCEPLQELLAFFHIPPDQAIAETQRLWLQKGKERWEFEPRFEEYKPQLWPLFERMGLFEEIAPLSGHYDYAIVHGALLQTVQARIDFLSELIGKGFKFDRIVFLTGARPLQEAERRIACVENEGEMVQWAYERSLLPKEIPVSFFCAPMKASRPNTADAIGEWLKTNPEAGSCFAVSNQPYIAYQNAVFLRLMPSSFSLETGGPAPKSAPSVALVLDTLAKQLYLLQR